MKGGKPLYILLDILAIIVFVSLSLTEENKTFSLICWTMGYVYLILLIVDIVLLVNHD